MACNASQCAMLHYFALALGLSSDACCILPEPSKPAARTVKQDKINKYSQRRRESGKGDTSCGSFDADCPLCKGHTSYSNKVKSHWDISLLYKHISVSRADWTRKLGVVGAPLGPDLPDGAPVITGLRSSYVARDWVDLTCTSRRSKPAPRVSFRINGDMAAPEWLEPQVDTVDSAGLTTSSRRLRFYLLPELLRDGDARLQCIAEIPHIYNQVTEDLLSTRPPYQASVLDASAASGTRIGSWLQVTPILSALLLASAAHCLLL
ncbi:uncharacterized protein [Penaeus vannamei]|uniref:uncharacterized protein n=1 Tax=Penaeus vannamei TaxID=6689 RepID=UPI00387F85EC